MHLQHFCSKNKLCIFISFIGNVQKTVSGRWWLSCSGPATGPDGSQCCLQDEGDCDSDTDCCEGLYCEQRLVFNKGLKAWDTFPPYFWNIITFKYVKTSNNEFLFFASLFTVGAMTIARPSQLSCLQLRLQRSTFQQRLSRLDTTYQMWWNGPTKRSNYFYKRWMQLFQDSRTMFKWIHHYGLIHIWRRHSHH